MIELTMEMERAMYKALAAEEPGEHHAAVRAGLAAVLAIVERDWILQPNPAPRVPAQCSEETWSWAHFNPGQLDAYWIRCTLQGPHGEHKDEHTGLTWTATVPKAPGGERDA